VISSPSTSPATPATATTAEQPVVLALDLSLNSTGWAKSDGSSGVITPPMRGYERLAYILDRVVDLAIGADVVAIESVFVGQKHQGVLDIAGLATLVRFTLWEAKHTLVDVPPASLKMFATGNGNAGKPDMLAAAIMKLAWNGSTDNNVIDARWLLEMAKAHYDGRALTGKQSQALAKIQWPALTPAHTEAL
jgi:Holliday junction resolvasome RuvABC endonuclease subunit